MATTNFINECKNRANGNRLGKITVEGVTSPITNSDNLQKIKISGGCYVDGNIIGTVYVKSLTANFTARNSNTDLIDKTIYAQIGVKYADNSTEYINMGKYIVDKPINEKTANLSQITAYTELINNLDNKYECSIDFSNNDVTLEDFYIDVCNQLGLTPTTTTFINSTIPVLANPFTNGEKNRVVLQTVAKIACSWVEIDDDTNKIDLCWLSQSETPDYTFYLNDYATLEGGEIKYGPINCLIIKNSQIDDENVTNKDQESIDLYGENSIVISEDYILYNAELRQQAINNIWNRVHNMTYVDAKLITCYGKPFLKLGAKIRIHTSETEYFDTYVLKHDFTYDGTFQSVIESPALTKQEIKTKQDITLQEKLSNTEIEINKQKQQINAVVSTQNEQGETLNQIQIDNENIKSTTSSIQTNLENNYYTVEKVNELIQNAETGLTNTFLRAGGNNLLRNTAPYFMESENKAEYWEGNVKRMKESNSVSGYALLLQNGTITQTINLSPNQYAIKFKYKKLTVAGTCTVQYNGRTIELAEEEGVIETTGTVNSGQFEFKVTCDTDNSFEIYDLMLNVGQVAMPWTQNANESTSDTVNISKGITVSSNTSNTLSTMNDDGFKVKNATTNEEVMVATDDGGKFKNIEANRSSIAGVLMQKIKNQTWISGV